MTKTKLKAWWMRKLCLFPLWYERSKSIFKMIDQETDDDAAYREAAFGAPALQGNVICRTRNLC